MSRWSRLIPAAAVTLFLAAACGDAGSSITGPGDARHDGGLVVGGNKSDSTSTGGSSGTTSTQGDSTSLGGGLVVGGN